MITAEIDLSIGSLEALSGSVAAVVIIRYGMPIAVGIAAAIATTVLAGAVSGFLTWKVKIVSFISTLAMLGIAQGIAFLLTNGNAVAGFPPPYDQIGTSTIHGFPGAVIIAIVVFVVLHLMLTRTKFGIHIYAVGGDAESAAFAGIRTGRIKLFALMISGFTAGIGGLILSSRLDAGNGLFGAGDLLAAVAAVVIGGTSLFGGVGIRDRNGDRRHHDLLDQQRARAAEHRGLLAADHHRLHHHRSDEPRPARDEDADPDVCAVSAAPAADQAGRVAVVEARGVSKAYGAVQALENVSLELYPGEVLGLVGDNGAGKSTLVKCLSGVHRPDSGEIVIDGKVQDALTAELSRELGIEAVYQNLSLVDTLDVMQNFFLNRELVYDNPLARAVNWTNRRRMYRETSEHLQALNLQVEARRPVSALSGGQRQMIAVARAITWGRHIVMLDEPAAALGVQQSVQVLKFVRTMAERGVAVLFISHNMQHVLQATDRIAVLRHGRNVGDVRTADATAQQIVSMITGAELVVEGQDVAV